MSAVRQRTERSTAVMVVVDLEAVRVERLAEAITENLRATGLGARCGATSRARRSW